MDLSTHLLDLPNEIIVYILRQFLDLGDVWVLLQVSRQVRHFAIDTIHKRWKIDPIFTPATIMKTQCRAALIALERLSTKLSTIQHQEEYYRLTAVAASAVDNHDDHAVPSHQHESSITTSTVATPAHDYDHDNHDDLDNDNDGNRNTTDDDDDDDDDSEAMEDLYHAAMTMRSTGLAISIRPGTPPPPPPPPPTSINIYEFLLTNVDCSTISTTNTTNDLDTILLQEKQLHQRIIQGINACKHKYVLLEDIDIRNRIRATVDVIFHHTVFVSSISRQDHPNNNNTLAVMMVRLLIRLDAAFSSYYREITYTLVDHIKAFLEFTGYKLLGLRSGCLHGRNFRLHSLISNGVTEASSVSTSSETISMDTTTSLLPASSSSSSSSSSISISTTPIPIRYSKTSSLATLPPPPSLQQQQQQQIYYSPPPSTCSLPPTLYSMAACFDLMGAAFIGKIIGETHVEGAVQKVCQVLTDDARHDLGQTKRTLLVDLLETWLTCERGLMASDLCRFVQSEIDMLLN